MSDYRQLAIVTGASTGIGFALAKCCAEEGIDLLIAANERAIEYAATVSRPSLEVRKISNDGSCRRAK